MLTFDYNGSTYANFAVADLIAAGVPSAIVAAALKNEASAQVADFADAYRVKLASASAGKLAEFRFKEEIGRDPKKADPAELAIIGREAAARGIKIDDLLEAIAAKTRAYRQIALLIGALEAEANAAIAAIDDRSPDIEADIATALAAARGAADKAFAEAQAMLAGR